MSITIEVLEDFSIFRGYIDNFVELKFERCYRNIGYLKLELNNFEYVDILTLGSQILINKKDLYIIQKIEQYKNVRGELIMNVEGADPSYFFQNRVMDRAYNLTTETRYVDFVRILIDDNIHGFNQDREISEISPQIFTQIDEKISKTLVPKLPFKFKIYNLKEAITRICSYGDFGYGFEYDLEYQENSIVPYTYKGADISNKVFFNEEFGNVENLELKLDAFNLKNVGYILDEEGYNIIETISLGNPTLLERRETLIEDEEQTNILQEFKRSYENIITMNIDILDTEQFKYRRDWDVGDTIMYESKTFNFKAKNTIMKVTEIYTNNNKYLEIKLGDRGEEFG